MLRFSKITRVLFLCVLAIFCFYQTTVAQSGRRVKKPDAPSEQKAPVESKPAENKIQKNETRERVWSLMVVGEVQHNFKFYKSNMIDGALKECVKRLRSTSRTVTKGSGKTSYEEAKKLAEKETITYVLWIGFLAKADDYGHEYIESVQYAVLTPKTAKVLTRGEIDPSDNKVVTSGGVLQIPTNSRRRSASVEMLLGAHKIAEILLRGWLD